MWSKNTINYRYFISESEKPLAKTLLTTPPDYYFCKKIFIPTRTFSNVSRIHDHRWNGLDLLLKTSLFVAFIDELCVTCLHVVYLVFTTPHACHVWDTLIARGYIKTIKLNIEPNVSNLHERCPPNSFSRSKNWNLQLLF